MRKIITVLGGLVLAAGLASAVPAPAQASPLCSTGGVCGTIGHTTNSGYDAPIYILCDYADGFQPNGEPRSWAYMNARSKLVMEGETSKKYCNDTDVVVVRDNEQIACRETDRFGNHSWPVRFDATGPHKINDTFNERWCVTQRD